MTGPTHSTDANGPTDSNGSAGFAEKLRSYEGRPTAAGGRGKDPVNAPMIRHWCEAMGDANPVYTDPEAASSSRFGGLIAPPAMLQAWTMDGLSGHADRTGPFDELYALLDEAGFISIVATNCEQEYLRPLRPGDEVSFDSVIESVSPQKDTALGTGHFITTRMDITVDGEPVGTHRFRMLKYRPRPKAPARPKRPRPVINRDNAPFWEAVAEHRLLIQRCTACGTPRFPWLPGCNACGSPEWKPFEASGLGTVYSYVVMHHPPFPAFAASSGQTSGAGPYAVALVELAEGVRILSNIVGVPHDEVRIGMEVALEFERFDDELTLPVFRAQDGSAG